MIAGFLLSVREGLEAVLIIGILLSTLKRIGRQDLRSLIVMGVGSAFVLSLGVSGLLFMLGISLQGKSEELFDGFMMLIAAGILTWLIFWMRRQGNASKEQLESGVAEKAAQSGKVGLFLLALTTVLREGIELAIFLNASAMVTEGRATVLGALLGLGVSILLGWLIFMTTLRLDLRKFFTITGFLLILFAAGLVASGVHELSEAGLVPEIIEHVWDINPWLSEDSLFGQVLKSLFGYNGNPALVEILAYVIFLVVIWVIWRKITPTKQHLRSIKEETYG